MKRMAPNHRLPWSMPVNRDDFLVQQCIDRRVLHLACASAPFTQALHQSNQLLHGKMSAVSSRIAGVDRNVQSLSYLRSHGFQHLFDADLLCADDIACLAERLPWRPDLLVAGELIEHLDQPGPALQIVSRLMSVGTDLILTVPNAFSAKSFLRVLLGHEKVSADHVAYYSLTNLNELASRNRLAVSEVHWYRSSFATHPAERILDGLLWPLLAMRPQVSDGIIVVCRKVADQTKHLDPLNVEVSTNDESIVQVARPMSQL